MSVVFVSLRWPVALRTKAFKLSMELLKYSVIFGRKNLEKTAIQLCSDKKILQTVTYGEVELYSKRIGGFLKKYEQVNSCVGLLMDKNVLLPSIIISFQELNCSFVFLTKETCKKTVCALNIQWILSYEYDLLSQHFILRDELQLLPYEPLRLWKSNCYSEERNNLSFIEIFCAVQTSGSTGDNKVIRIPHRCIEKNAISLNKHFGLSNSDVIYWGTPMTFDPSLIEFLLGVLSSATLIIVPKLVSLVPELLYDALFKIGKISFLQVVPSLFLRWNKEQINNILQYSCLKTLAFGGEPFPQEIFDFKWRKNLQVYNLYGLTELSCWATIFNVNKTFNRRERVPLGIALDDTFVELRNKNEECITSGSGEIYIGSYTRFCLINSNNKADSPFMVKTGDLGELSQQGISYKGRTTRIVKRFGKKVNLHQLEEVILKETNLSSRLVYSNKHKKLLAFILIEENFDQNTKIKLLDKLRVKLLKIIPDTELPDFIDLVAAFPLNTHGKITDKILEKYYENSSKKLVGECSPKEIFLLILNRYLKTTLENETVVLGEYTFFELGGNSITAMQILSEFENSFGCDISGELVTLLLNENIKSCIEYVTNTTTLKRKLVEEHEYENKILQKKMEESDGPEVVVWKYNLNGCVDASPLVFVSSNNTYVGIGSFAHIFAILNENGEEHFKLTLPQEVEARPSISKCGYLIFIGCSNGSMYCINLLLKKVVWTYNTLQKITSSACFCNSSEAIVFGNYDSNVFCLNKNAGTLLWQTKLIGSIRGDAIYSKSAKSVFIGTTKGMCYSLSNENGSIIWSYKIDGPIFGSPCIFNECIVWPCVTGVLYSTSFSGCLEWSKKINGNIFSSLVAHENNIYFGCHDSNLYKITVIESDKTAEINKIFQLESEISSSPFVYLYNDKELIICVCNIGILYAVESDSGNIVIRYKLPAPSFSSPFVFKNMIYVGCRDNYIYCINIEQALIK